MYAMPVKQMLERRRYARRVTDKKCKKMLGDAAKRRGVSPVNRYDAALHVVLHTVADDGCA